MEKERKEENRRNKAKSQVQKFVNKGRRMREGMTK